MDASHPPARGRRAPDQRGPGARSRVVRIPGDGHRADRLGALAEERADPRAARAPRAPRGTGTFASPARRDARAAQARARDVPGGAGVTKFDPNAAATGGGIFGLPHSPAEARVVLVPVPFEATTSYGGW